jgi:hypothetical protein
MGFAGRLRDRDSKKELRRRLPGILAGLDKARFTVCVFVASGVQIPGHYSARRQ